MLWQKITIGKEEGERRRSSKEAFASEEWCIFRAKFFRRLSPCEFAEGQLFAP